MEYSEMYFEYQQEDQSSVDMWSLTTFHPKRHEFHDTLETST